MGKHKRKLRPLHTQPGHEETDGAVSAATPSAASDYRDRIGGPFHAGIGALRALYRLTKRYKGNASPDGGENPE